MSSDRKQQHEIGRQLMFDGDYFGSLQTFQKALEKYGPHVGLVSDTIAVLYLLGRIEDSQKMARKLMAELEFVSNLLAPQSLANTQIFLGKMLEEQAEVGQALSFYEQAQITAEDLPEIKLRSQAQILRLKSYLGQTKGLQELYVRCNQIKLENTNSLKVELEHGLILAEVILFGPTTAIQRLKNLIKYDISISDLKLVVIDLAEEIVGGPCAGEIEPLVKRLSYFELDEFEKCIYDYFCLPEEKTEVPIMNDRISLMCWLRVLVLCLKRAAPYQNNVEIKRQILFLLNGLSSTSKDLLTKKWRSLVDSQDIQIQLKDLKEGSFGRSCLALLCEKPEIAITEFCQKMYGEEYGLNHYDRIRTALARLNKDLGRLTGHPKILQITKNSILINPQIKIRIISA